MSITRLGITLNLATHKDWVVPLMPHPRRCVIINARRIGGVIKDSGVLKKIIQSAWTIAKLCNQFFVHAAGHSYIIGVPWAVKPSRRVSPRGLQIKTKCHALPRDYSNILIQHRTSTTSRQNSNVSLTQQRPTMLPSLLHSTKKACVMVVYHLNHFSNPFSLRLLFVYIWWKCSKIKCLLQLILMLELVSSQKYGRSLRRICMCKKFPSGGSVALWCDARAIVSGKKRKQESDKGSGKMKKRLITIKELGNYFSSVSKKSEEEVDSVSFMG